MVLLVPLLLTTALIRFGAGWLVLRGRPTARYWASWPAAMAGGMAAVFVSTTVTHFIEPQRSGLVAILPSFVPWPELAVTLTGIAELGLAIGLIIRPTRRWAGIGAVVLLLALFPANIIAALGVSHPAAPSTPLVWRAALQLTFIAFSAAAVWPLTMTGEKEKPQPDVNHRAGV